MHLQKMYKILTLCTRTLNNINNLCKSINIKLFYIKPLKNILIYIKNLNNMFNINICRTYLIKIKK